MPDDQPRPPVTDEIAQRIGEQLVGLLRAKHHRAGGSVTSEGVMSDAVLGHRVLRLIDEAFLVPDVAPPTPKATTTKRTANGWTLVFVARDRHEEPWTIWQNSEGEHQVTKGDGKLAEAPPADAGGWKDLNRLMKLRGLVERPG
jgi:hypothetical protein